MSSYRYCFYKYICFTALCGILSALLAVVSWFLISGVSLMEDLFDILSIFITCWTVGGIVALLLFSKLHHLAFYTYMFSIMIFFIITLFLCEWNDVSTRGWIVTSIYGYIIVCFPGYYINTKYIAPNFQCNKNT